MIRKRPVIPVIILMLVFLGGSIEARKTLKLTSITFNEKFDPIDPVIQTPINFMKVKLVIPFGTKIVLRGKCQEDAVGLTLKWIAGEVTGKADVKVDNQLWETQVGEFPPGKNIVFEFNLKIKMKEEEKKLFEESLRTTMDKVVMEIFKKGYFESHKDLDAFVREKALNFFPSSSDKFVNKDGKNLKKIVFEKITAMNNTDKIKLYNHSRNLGNYKRSKKEEIKTLKKKLSTKDVKEYIAGKAEKAIIDSFIKSPEDIVANSTELEKLKSYVKKMAAKKKISISDGDIVLARLNTFKENVRIIKELEKTDKRTVDQIISESVKEVFKSEYQYIKVFPISSETSDIQRYAGFDVSVLWINKKQGGRFGTFFIINPYFVATDLHREPKTLWERLTLSFGISLTDIHDKQEGPAYYLGGAIRINKVFRFTAGVTMIQEDDEYTFPVSLGFAVNFNDFSDLLAIFKGSSAYFKKNE